MATDRLLAPAGVEPGATAEVNTPSWTMVGRVRPSTAVTSRSGPSSAGATSSGCRRQPPATRAESPRPDGTSVWNPWCGNLGVEPFGGTPDRRRLMMRALRLQRWKSEPELVEVPDPVPGPGQVVVRIGGGGAGPSD